MKISNFWSCIFSLSFAAGVPVFENRTEAQSAKLSIQASTDRRARISWPAAADNLQLESASPLARPPVWQPVSQAPSQVGGEFVLSVDSSQGERYYRLRGTGAPALTTIAETSPATGETGVAVTRETIVHFSAPLDSKAQLTPAQFYAEFGGRKILSRVELSSDRHKATLFYLENLPSSARVRVTLIGDSLSDAQGRVIDVDGDDRPGGIATIDFETYSTTPVTGTAVMGRVFASELVAGPDTGANAVNKPLEGVIITVDGAEQTLRTTTDAQGNFKITNSPAGRFFVHIDGRTAQGSSYPNGSYYPVVGKAWEAAAGRQDNLAGGTGEIYLPLIKVGTLQPVSATQDTAISIPPEMVASNPSLQGVSIIVPANSLFSDNGTRGGKVGIAPVPPNRLPEPLPAGLEMPIVITVQTDGASNFDKPVPVCFPNLPDPVTKQPLPAGSQQWLISFNHDKGEWEGIGSMTVSADGKLICTDSGVGILQPGWHGVGPQPATPPPPGPTCGGGAPGPSLARHGIRLHTTAALPLPCPDPTETCPQANASCRDNCHAGFVGCALAFSIGALACTALGPAAPLCLAILGGLGAGYCGDTYHTCLVGCDTQNASCLAGPAVSGLHSGPQAAPGLPSIDDPLAQSILDRTEQIRRLILPFVPTGGALPADVNAQITALAQEANALAGGNALNYLQSYQTRFELSNQRDESASNAPYYPIRYAAEISRPQGSLVIRGLTEPRGRYSVFVPRDGTLVAVYLYDPVTRTYDISFPRVAPSAPYRLPQVMLKDGVDSLPDRDRDGLADVMEVIYASDPDRADSDGDGIPDGTEVDKGTDPVDGRPALTGIVASASVPGTARDVVTANDLALVALGDRGLGVFNIFNGLRPVLVSLVDTPGTATAVAYDGTFAAVADGNEGLAVFDVSDPANTRLVRQIDLGGHVIAVAAADGLAYAGVSANKLAVVHMGSGAIIQTIDNLAVHDLVITGQALWCLLATELRAYRIDPLALTLLGTSPGLSFFPEGITDRRRLFVGGGYAYATGYPGAEVIEVRDPAAMVFTSTPTDRGVANSFKQIVLDGGGYGVAAVGVNPRADGTHDVYLYDTKNPAIATDLLTVLPTPGLTYAVALHNGLVYAADGLNGLQVLNYRPPDLGKTPPTLTLSASFPLNPPRAEERRPSWLEAGVTDDISVRSVEFYLDGARVHEDGAFPFEWRFTTPERTATRTQFKVRAKATDTAGNSTWSPEFSVDLVPDATGPAFLGSIPAPGSTARDGITELRAVFNEPLQTPVPDSFVVVGAGADIVFGTADDVTTTGVIRLGNPDELILDLSANPVPNGTHRAVLRTSVSDLAGNPLLAERFWTFMVNDTTRPRIVSTTPVNGDNNIPLTLNLITASLSEPLHSGKVSAESVTLHGAGQDGSLGTRDDRILPAQGLEVRDDGRTLRLTYAQPFGPDLYRATLSSNVTDLSGNLVTGALNWEFTVPLRSTLRGRAVFADQSPAPGATVRQHERALAFGQTGAGGEFLFPDVAFEFFARPDLNVHLVSGNRAFLGRALKINPVSAGITELGTIVLEEVCAPRLENHLAAESDFLDQVFGFAEFDDGTGSALYAAGTQRRQDPGERFASVVTGLFRHDGSGWRRINGDFDGTFTPQIRAMTGFNDGRGRALYVAGYFESVNGAAATNVARWNGQTWEAVGTGVQVENRQPYGVNVLTVFDDGSGPALYAGGRFDSAGGAPAANFARWNGQSWSAPGGGITSSELNRPNDPESAQVRAMAVFNDGTGPGLFVGGIFNFTPPGGTTVNATNLVRWKAGQWSALGRGVYHAEFAGGSVNTLAVFNDGVAEALYAGGSFDRAGDVPVNHLARWNGTAWSVVGESDFRNQVTALVPWEDQQGRALLASGPFYHDANGSNSSEFTRWNGQQWSRLGGAQDTLTDAIGVQAYAVITTAAGRALFLGGSLGVTDAEGSLNSRGSVRWDGTRWQPTEQSFDGEIRSLTAWDDGKGSALVLAGTFTTGAGQRLFKLAKWDGQQASQLGEGIRPMDFGRSSLVNAVASFDDGTGPALYVAGYFATRGASSVTNFARWNGAAWSAVGDLEFVRGPFVIAPNCLAVFNDGTGPALYVAGPIDRIFDASGARFIDPIMSWNGTEWRTFRTLTRNGGGGGAISQLLPVHSGPARGLYFGGNLDLQNSGTGRFRDLGVWDGQEFRSPGDFSTVFPANNNFDRTLDRGVESLGVMETPEGTEIYFGARFRATDTIGLARMRNGHWERLPALPDGSEFTKDIFNFGTQDIGAMSGFDDGFGPQLYVAAPIQTPDGAGMFQQRSWARWTGAQWELLDPVVASQRITEPVFINHRLTSTLLPYDLNGRPALLRSSTSLVLAGQGLVRWLRPNGPCQ